MKHVALITASIEVIAGKHVKHVVTCLEAPDLKASADDEETAIAMARKVATLALGDALRYRARHGRAIDFGHLEEPDSTAKKEFAESLSKLGDESVVPLDEEPAAAPITDTNDNEAGTPE